MPTTHLLIVAHGSRRAASNDEVQRLAERVRRLCGPQIAGVEVAFLELAEPSIHAGLARCAAAGADEIVVFPYFLAAGTHVAQDIPDAVAAFAHAHPNLRVRLTPHLGASDALPGAILAVALSGAQVAAAVATCGLRP